MACWRNGSASDSRSEGWGFESLTGQSVFWDLPAPPTRRREVHPNPSQVILPRQKKRQRGADARRGPPESLTVILRLSVLHVQLDEKNKTVPVGFEGVWRVCGALLLRSRSCASALEGRLFFSFQLFIATVNVCASLYL